MNQYRSSVLPWQSRNSLSPGRWARPVILALGLTLAALPAVARNITDDPRLQALAHEYNITVSKAALADLLVQQDQTLSFTDAAALSVDEINQRLTAMDAASAPSQAASPAPTAGFIDADRAKAIALEHAGVAESSLTELKIKVDHEHGRSIYEVEFRSNGREYEYEIDAITGAILQFEQEPDDDLRGDIPFSGTISLDQATAIALTHGGFTAPEVQIVKATHYRKRGIWMYNIVFLASNASYRYEINAHSGEVMAFYRNRR